MKNNILKHIFLALAMVLGLASCSDRELITVESQSAPILMDLSKSTVFLDSNFPNSTALTVSWDRAGYTVPVAVKYRLEMSNTETFAKKVAFPETSEKFITVTNKELNEKVKELGLVPYKAQKLYFRVTSYLGGSDLSQVSNVSNLTITPYLASPTYNYVDLYLIGNATPADWSNNATNQNMMPLLKTASKNVYTYTGFFKAGKDIGFKIVRDKGSWDPQYGYGGAEGSLSTDGGSSDLKAPADGYYKLTIDTDALTYKLEKVDVPATTYNKVSIIGSVNGNWDKDTQMVQSAFDPHIWTLHGVSLKAGEFKFRANDAWDVSWGTNAEYFGTATKGGANIPLSSDWTYDIYFNDATGAYTIIPVK